MKNMNDTEVLIDGRKYTICGFESDEYLQQIASYINRKFTEFKKKDYYRRLDLDLRNVLLAINIADDYHKAKKKVREYKDENEIKDKLILDMKHEIIGLQETAKKSEEKMEELENSLEDAEKKIIELETRLKQKK
ncbi:MAG: cell division protein ZapA [Lachnospiraceae bacterium]|nr:cell division protein ZapA [Lachnospiraceae bacterium]